MDGIRARGRLEARIEMSKRLCRPEHGSSHKLAAGSIDTGIVCCPAIDVLDSLKR